MISNMIRVSHTDGSIECINLSFVQSIKVVPKEGDPQKASVNVIFSNGKEQNYRDVAYTVFSKPVGWAFSFSTTGST